MAKKISNKRLSFYIALVYVILATTYGLWEMPNLVNGGILFYLFLPATIFTTIILFTEQSPGIMILICQVLTLLIIWGLLWLFIYLLRGPSFKGKPLTDL